MRRSVVVAAPSVFKQKGVQHSRGRQDIRVPDFKLRVTEIFVEQCIGCCQLTAINVTWVDLALNKCLAVPVDFLRFVTARWLLMLLHREFGCCCCCK